MYFVAFTISSFFSEPLYHPFMFSLFLIGPSFPTLALQANFVMWRSASWIRGSDPTILNFVPGNREGVPLHLCWLCADFGCVGFLLSKFLCVEYNYLPRCSITYLMLKIIFISLKLWFVLVTKEFKLSTLKICPISWLTKERMKQGLIWPLILKKNLSYHLMAILDTEIG